MSMQLNYYNSNVLFYWILLFYVFRIILQVNYVKTQDLEATTYNGAQVWRTKLRGDQDISTVVKLVKTGDISLWVLEHDRADFLVNKKDKVKVNRVLNRQNLNHSVLIMDVQRRVDTTKGEPALWNEDTLRIGHRLNWKEYPTLRVIHEYYSYLTENFPSICNVTTIGFTTENRSINVVKISNGNPHNKAIIVTSGMHAREWLAITSVLYVLDKVVTKFDHLPKYMKSIDWLFIPVVNPDGYAYTHNFDRLWRKNRRKMNLCYGVDINRNFGIDWELTGIKDNNECYEAYSGPKAFSEAETKALRNFILESEKIPFVMLDIHSYGQLILYPWSARSVPAPDKTLLWSTARTMAETINNNTGKTYKYGATYHMIYPATGAAIDWMYHKGVLLSFGMEVGDEGEHGFLAPSESIEPIGQDLLLAVKELLKHHDPESIKKQDRWF